MARSKPAETRAVRDWARNVLGRY